MKMFIFGLSLIAQSMNCFESTNARPSPYGRGLGEGNGRMNSQKGTYTLILESKGHFIYYIPATNHYFTSL